MQALFPARFAGASGITHRMEGGHDCTQRGSELITRGGKAPRTPANDACRALNFQQPAGTESAVMEKRSAEHFGEHIPPLQNRNGGKDRLIARSRERFATSSARIKGRQNPWLPGSRASGVVLE